MLHLRASLVMNQNQLSVDWFRYAIQFHIVVILIRPTYDMRKYRVLCQVHDPLEAKKNRDTTSISSEFMKIMFSLSRDSILVKWSHCSF